MDFIDKVIEENQDLLSDNLKEEQPQFSEPYVDEDAAYEEYRDKWTDALSDDIDELIKKTLETNSYYKGRQRKLLEHILIDVQFKKQLLKEGDKNAK